MSEIELKPCPFCGVELYQCDYASGASRWAHEANDCVMSKRFVSAHQLAAWNSRAPASPTIEDQPITFGYTNWRGEYAERTAIPMRIERKKSEWHGAGLNYVMVAFDVEKQAERDFLLTDMGRAAPNEETI